MDQQLDRAGDRDRQRTADYLSLALAQGYLQLHEFEQRSDAAFEARTAGGLRELLDDLPLDRIRRDDPRRRATRIAHARKAVRIHLGAYLMMAAIVLTVWAAVAATTTATYFWPIWPIMGGAIGLISHALATPKPLAINA